MHGLSRRRVALAAGLSAAVLCAAPARADRPASPGNSDSAPGQTTTREPTPPPATSPPSAHSNASPQPRSSPSPPPQATPGVPAAGSSGRGAPAGAPGQRRGQAQSTPSTSTPAQHGGRRTRHTTRARGSAGPQRRGRSGFAGRPTNPLQTGVTPGGPPIPLAALLNARTAASRSGASGEGTAPESGTIIDRIVDRLPDWSRPVIALLIALAVVLWVRSLAANARSRRLARQHAQVVDDLAVLQSALVPDVPGHIGALVASVAYRPADGPGAGGDFYDAFELDRGRVAIVAGDASGHGRDAIARATAVRYRLRAYLEIGLSPREALRTAGHVLAAEEDGAFATAVLAIHDPATNVLTYACAGHPPPIVAGPGEHEPITACSAPPIGWGLATGVRQTSVSLGEGSRALFFTDGMIEARRSGEMLGRDRLTEIVHDLGAGDSAGTALERVRELADDASDDMAALLLLHTTSEGPSDGARVEELELDAADLRHGLAETFLDALGLDAQEVLTTMRVVHVAARARRPVLVRAEIRGGNVAVEAFERLGEEVAPPPFIKAAPDSRVEFERAAVTT